MKTAHIVAGRILVQCHRRTLLLALAGAALGGLHGPAAADPQANLLVSWRVVSSSRGSDSREGLRRGEVIVDSRRGVLGRGGVEWASGSSTYEGSAMQQVLVMNGGRARIDVRRESPRTVWQWVGGMSRGSLINPEAQAELVAQTVWIDSGQGLAARPRWPGGSAPVMLELEAEAPLPGVEGARAYPRGDGEDPPPRLSAQTTLSVPMGQWVAVARTHQQEEGRQARGLWQSGQGHEDQAVLEVRVTRP